MVLRPLGWDGHQWQRCRVTGSLWLGVRCADAKAVEALEHAIHHHIGQRLWDRRKTGRRDVGGEEEVWNGPDLRPAAP